MKRILCGLALLLTLCVSRATHAQSIPADQLREVLALYTDGQYDIVKAKLGNLGYAVTESTPDYSLNGTAHAGTFTLMRRKDGEVDRFFFATDAQSVERRASVTFEYTDATADYTLRNFVSNWAADYAPDGLCPMGDNCAVFQRKEGAEKFATLSLRLHPSADGRKVFYGTYVHRTLVPAKAPRKPPGRQTARK